MLDFFYYIVYFFDNIGLALCIFSLLKPNNNFITFRKKKIVIIYYCAYFSLSLIGNLYPYLLSKFALPDSNNWIYDNIPIILSIILFFFFNSLTNSKKANRITQISFCLLILYYVANWKLSIDKDPNTEFYLVFTIFSIINSLVYLIDNLAHVQTDSIFDKGEFWFISSLLFYSGGCTLFWTFYKEMYSKYPTQFNLVYLWITCHNTILFISCIIFSLAIYLKTRPSH